MTATKPKRIMPKKKKRIGICVGHSRPGDSGARAFDRTASEWQYWAAFGKKVCPLLRDAGYVPILHTLYNGLSYTDAMSWISAQLRGDGCAAANELHFNAYNGKAGGFEALHWGGSRNGAKLAGKILDAQRDRAPDFMKDRGRKPISSSGRGSQWLRKTHCPAIIWEPFFGDNKEEWEHYSSLKGREELMETLVKGVSDYFG